MALGLAVAHLAAVSLILLVSFAWGTRALGLLGLKSEDALADLLLAAGFSFACLEVVLVVLVVPGWLRFDTALPLLALMGVTAGRGWPAVWKMARALIARLGRDSASWLDRGAGLAIVAFLGVEGLLAMAPLTGSDAMHYHFTVPLLEAGHRLLPIFWLTHSFFLGQGHLLISLGLALGSDRISMGLLYLGGVLATGATLVLARQLMPERWARLAALVFVASPTVFWQSSTSGSPDLWMAFFVPLAVIAAQRGVAGESFESSNVWLLLAGFFAGAAAGVKYTGWVIPLALAAYVMIARRSLKLGVSVSAAAMGAGIWPLARNWMWTRDPVFPFLTPTFVPSLSNPFALAAIKSMTSTEGFGRDAWHLLRFPFALVLHGDSYGLGQYFGPFILAFAPMLLFAPWQKQTARIAVLLWGITFVSIAFANQMGRFLLPVYPLALALVFSGAAVAAQRGWRLAVTGCTATIALFLLFAAGADAIYAKNFLPVVLGMEREEAFLRRAAPDYEIDEFIDHALRDEMDRAQGGRVMVFYRHLYYLRVPFVEGAPENSWLMNPDALRDPRAMVALLKSLDVRWIVKTDEYPESLEPVLAQMEQGGVLTPVASADILNLTGASRIYRQTENVHVAVMRVRDEIGIAMPNQNNAR